MTTMTKQRQSRTSTRRLMTNEPRTETALSNEKESEKQRQRRGTWQDKRNDKVAPIHGRQAHHDASSDRTRVTRHVNIHNGLKLQ